MGTILKYLKNAEGKPCVSDFIMIHYNVYMHGRRNRGAGARRSDGICIIIIVCACIYVRLNGYQHRYVPRQHFEIRNFNTKIFSQTLKPFKAYVNLYRLVLSS